MKEGGGGGGGEGGIQQIKPGVDVCARAHACVRAKMPTGSFLLRGSTQTTSPTQLDSR